SFTGTFVESIFRSPFQIARAAISTLFRRTPATDDLRLKCFLDAETAKRTIARAAAVLRLDYIRVTACRTDFRAFFEPPWRVLLGLLHGNQIRSISSSTRVMSESGHSCPSRHCQWSRYKY